MTLTTEQIGRAEAAVLAELRERGGWTAPRAVIDGLKEQGYGEEELRAAIWYLIDRYAVRLSRDRKIEAV